MLVRRWLWTIGLGACAAQAGAEPVDYALDAAHSFAHFELVHFGTSTIRGRFGPLAGKVVLDRTDGRGKVDLTIDTASVSTGLRPFDARIREGDLLATSLYPQARFVAEDFRFDGERLVEVRGTFTLRAVSQPLTLHALRFGCESRAPPEREVCGGDFEAEIRRSDFGINFLLPFVADRVHLVIQVEGIRQE